MPPRRKSKPKQAPKKRPENAPVDPSLDTNLAPESSQKENLPLNDNKTSERRASLLFKANDDIVRNSVGEKSVSGNHKRLSIDDAISSAARLSASHTDELILRKPSISGVGEMQVTARQTNKEHQDRKTEERTQADEELATFETEAGPGVSSGVSETAEGLSRAPDSLRETPEIREPVPEKVDSLKLTSESTEPSKPEVEGSDQFESAIKENKLEFDDEPSPDVPADEKIVPEISPMTVPEGVPGQKNSSTISELEIEGAQNVSSENAPEHTEEQLSEKPEQDHQQEDVQDCNEKNQVYYHEQRENEDHHIVAHTDHSLVGDTAPSQDNQTEEVDPPTLINDQRLSEVQEYIPGVKEEDAEDFQPDLHVEEEKSQNKGFVENVPEQTERTTEEPGVVQGGIEDHPVESQHHVDSRYSVENFQNSREQSQIEKLPWEEEEEEEEPAPLAENSENKARFPWEDESHESSVLHWEAESAPDSQKEVDQRPFPWQEQKDVEERPLPWEREQVQPSEEVLPWDKELKDGDLLSEQLPWANENAEIPVEASKVFENHSTNEFASSRPPSGVSEPQNGALKSYATSEMPNKLPDFLDDTDFLTDAEAPPSGEAHSSANNADDAINEYSNSKQHYEDEARYYGEYELHSSRKEKPLELLDLDDDMLLDDDFLPEEPKGPASPSLQKKPRQTYVPTQTAASPHYTAPANVQKMQELSVTLEAAKKKNDAYDFPSSFISQKVRPAARNLKYAPAQPSMVPPTTFSGLVGAPPESSSVPPPSTVSSLSGESKPPVPPKTIQKQKSFFEELPITMPKAAARPARAAASASGSLIPASGLLQLSQVPAALPAKSPVNPYSQMGPRQGQYGLIQNPPPTPQGILPPQGGVQPSLQPNRVPSGPVQQGMNQYAPNQQSQSQYAPNQGPGLNGQNKYAPGQIQFAPPSGHSQYAPPAGQNMPPPTLNMPPPSFQNHPLPAQHPDPTHFPPSQHQRRPSINSPSNIATNMVKDTRGQLTSPYVPNAGPYAPSTRQKTHSRANSLVGAKNKEVNPYAPALPSVAAAGPQQSVRGVVPPSNATGSSTFPGQGAAPTYISRDSFPHNAPPRASLYARQLPQVAKVQDPSALLKRQFPIFHWSESLLVVSLVPNAVHNAYDHNVGSIKVRSAGEVLRNKDFFLSFPGPLGRSKSAKKELEKWLDTNAGVLRANGSNAEELLLAEVLQCLVKYDGDTKSPDFSKAVCSVFNPTVDYNAEVSFPVGAALNTSANAYKLDAAGINTVWGLVQVGRSDAAVDYALSKSDWAIALIIAASLGPERFANVAADYARTTFPHQASQNKVQHLMPVLLKVFAGQTKAVVDDFVAVPSEGEWACLHYREIVAAVVSNGSSRTSDFLMEFGHFLASAAHATAAEVCYMLAGVPLGVPFANGRQFSTVGSETFSAIYTEVYEYVLQMPTGHTPGPILPHLLIVKLQHAQVLADYGLFVEAQKYCDHIGSSLKTVGKLLMFGPAAFREFQVLLERLSGASNNDNSWFSSRISKVNLDKMWGQLDRFIGGEDAKPANGEHGVFAKFSPSVSRTTSTVDFTALPQTLPQVRNDYSRDTLVMLGAVSAPTTASDGSILGFSRPPLGPTNSSSTILKYLPGYSQHSGPAVQRPEPHQANPLTVNLAHQVSPGGPTSYVPQHSPGSPSNLNSLLRQPQGGNDPRSDLLPPKRLHPKYLSSHKGVAPPRNYPYGNKSAQASTLSLGSHISINPPHVWGPPQTLGPHNQRQHSVTSINSVENDMPTQPISQGTHQRTSSAQSDVSMDFPQDFKPAARKQEPNEIVDRTNGPFRESIHEPIRESPELETQNAISGPQKPVSGPPEPQPISGPPQPIAKLAQEVPLPPLTDSLSQPAPMALQQTVLEPDVVSKQEPKAEALYERPAPQESTSLLNEGYSSTEHAVPQDTPAASRPESRTTEAPTSALPPPKAAAKPKVNPYAPGSAIKAASRAGKYGPPLSASKYSVPGNGSKADSGIVTGVPSGASYGDAFGYTSTVPESAVQSPPKESVKPVSSAPIVGGDQETSKFAPPTFRSPQKPLSANVDLSFDSDRGEDDFSQSPLPKGSLLLNTETSPGQLSKDALFNPYQSDRKRPAGFGGINSEFGDFPIPGSPDLTTRANSVIGGPGLFSLRLSQSHQLALYQQYEVQDDTVRDYVPLPEEDEEDDPSKEAAKKKEEQERKARVAADKAKQKADAAAAKRQASAEGGSWLNWLGGNKNDGKPKPVRVHLGGANKLVYNEEHKRWINPDIPLEEQLAANKAPPPPKKKVVETPKPPGGAIPRAPGGAPLGKAPDDAPVATPSAPSGPPAPSLASAGLEDLISLGSAASSAAGSTAAARKGRKTRGRGYVNVLEQK